MQRARRTVVASGAAAKVADGDTRNLSLYGFLSFLIVSSALMAAEIRSEFATISALPRSQTGAIAAQPKFVAPTRATTVASAPVPQANDKD